MKKLIIMAITCTLISGFGIGQVFAADKVVLRLDTHEPTTGQVSQLYQKFKSIVEKKSNGQVEVKLYYSNQLGSPVETLEMCQAGNLQVALGSDAQLASLTNVFEVFHLPFFFETRKQYLKAMNSPKIRKIIDDDLAKADMKFLAFFENGVRQIATTKKKIEWPSDLKGVKLRASPSPISVASLEAFGAAVTQLPWPECYDALKMGVIDGLTVHFAAYRFGRLDEVLGYIGELNWMPFGGICIANKTWWDNKVPQKAKDAIKEAFEETAEWYQPWVRNFANGLIKEMIADGTEIYRFTPEQQKAFRELAKPVWKKFAKKGLCPQEFQDLLKAEMGPSDGSGWDYTY